MAEEPLIVGRVTVVGRATWFSAAGLVGLAAPLLLFPDRFRGLCGAVLLLAALLQLRRATGRLTSANLPAWPVVMLAVMAALGLLVSVRPDLSWPKFCGLALDLGVFLFVAAIARDDRQGPRIAGVLILCCAAVALLGVLGTDWKGLEWAPLRLAAAKLPHVISSVQTSQQTSNGFHPNEVGGTLGMLLPLAISAVFFSSRRRFIWWGALLVLLASGSVMVLTQSRSAMAGLAVAFGLIIMLRYRLRLRWLLALLVSAAIGLLLLWVRLQPLLLRFIWSTGNSAPGVRLEVWQRSLELIRMFPLTGMGLNTLPVVAPVLAPVFSWPPDQALPHAHDLYLQTALDLGLPGLVAFAWILVAALASLKKTWLVGSRPRWLTAGLAAGLLSHMVFSLTDAVTLGAKPDVFLWVLLGLAISGSNPVAALPESRWAVRMLERRWLIAPAVVATWLLLKLAMINGASLLLEFGAMHEAPESLRLAASWARIAGDWPPRLGVEQRLVGESAFHQKDLRGTLEAMPPPGRDVVDDYWSGQAAFGLRDDDTAFAYWDHPALAGKIRSLASDAMAGGDLDLAERYLRIALRLRGPGERALAAMALAGLERGRGDAAQEQQALQLAADDSSASHDVRQEAALRLAETRSDWPTAVELLQLRWAASRGTPDALRLASDLLAQGQPSQAAAVLSAQRQRDGGNGQLALALGDALEQAGQTGEAKEVYVSLAATLPSFRFEALLGEFRLDIRLNQLEDARPLLPALAQLDPQTGELAYWRGRFEAAQGQWQAAIQDYRQAIAQASDRPSLLHAASADLSNALSSTGDGSGGG